MQRSRTNMSVERARKFLSQFGMEDKIITFKESSATVELAAKAGADRVELYTEPYATNYVKFDPETAVKPFVIAAKKARECGMGLNAGHDLSLVNLKYLKEQIPWLDEVSIGHALVCDALYLGLEKTINEYKKCIK